jgi:hypothetical protein
MQEAGSISDYEIRPGQNRIHVLGTGSAVRYLARLPLGLEIRAGIAENLHSYESASSIEVENITSTGHITGTITGPDGLTPLEGVRISAYRYDVSRWIIENSAFSGPDGVYDIDSLPFSSYKVVFEDTSGVYVKEYYDDQRTFNDADFVSVFEGQTVPDINASLAQAGFISGIVTRLEGGSSLKDIAATAYYTSTGSWQMANSAISAADGSYLIKGLLPGTYRVRFSDVYSPPSYIDEYFDNVAVIDNALDIIVTAGVTTTGIDAAMGTYGSLSGTVYGPDGTTPVEDVYADVYSYNPSSLDWEWVSYGQTDSNGDYTAAGLDTGDYRVEFSDPLGQLANEVYLDAPDLDSGDDVHVELGLETPGIDAVLALQELSETTSLENGWNLISTPLLPTSSAPADAFASISGYYNLVWAYEGCDTSDPWKRFDPSAPPPTNDLTSVDHEHGYWLQTTTQTTLVMTGTLPLATDISLCEGWNLIGYPSLNAEAVTTVLAPISGKFNLVYAYDATNPTDPWLKYNPSQPVGNTLSTFQPWYGYWIRMTQPATLTITSR